MSELAKWKCHKTVRAAEITEVIGHEGTAFVMRVKDANGAPCVAALPSARIDEDENKAPQVGDFFVVYDDGDYKSWSPREVFLAGYELIRDER